MNILVVGIRDEQLSVKQLDATLALKRLSAKHARKRA